MEGTDYSFLGSHLEKTKPLTERQQMALLLQMSSESPKCDKEAAQRNKRHVSGSPSTPKSMLRRNQRGETPLHVAAIKGDQKRIKQLLADGAPVDATDFAGWTPLHEAANRGHFEACRVLLQNGANSNALGLDSFTPLHDACINGHFPVVHLLLQHGADPKLPNIQGKTPIDVAGTPVIYRILTEFKPEIDISLVSSPKENSKTSSLKSSNQWGEETGLWTPPSQKTTPNRPKLASSLRRGLAESWAASDHTYGKLDPNLEGVSLLPLTPESTNGKGMNWADCLSDSDTENNDIVYRQRPSAVSRTSKKSLLQENNALEQAIPIVPGEKLLSYSSQSEFDPFKSTLLFAMENKDGVNGEPNNPDTRNKDGALKMEDKTEGEMKSEKDEHNNKEGSGLKRCADQLTEEEPEEDGRRKRKKEESKETTSKLNTASSARTGKNNPKTKQTKQPANSVTNSTATVATSDRKSPHTLPEGAKGGANTQTSVTVSQSPKRPLEDSDEDSKKSSDSHSSSSSSQSGPKVPPLKIVLNVEHETGSIKSGKNGGGRLPYVVSAEEKDKSSEVTQNCTGKDTVDGKTTSAAVAENANSNSNDSSSSCVGEKQTGGRVTRSSQRAAASLASQSPSPTPNSTNTPSPVNQATETEGSEGKERSTSPKTTENVTNKEEKTGGTGKREEDGEANQKVVGTGSTGSMHATGTQPTSQSVVDVHPRKRKLRPKETEPPVANETAPVQAPVPPEPAPATNCYEMYLHIRRQIDRRRKNLFPIQPKPPQGFKDYLMNRCTYVLAGNSASRLSVPVISPPPSLPGAMRDLFTEQEKERYKLRMQHLIEKEKLVLSVEQEILRVHGRAARALANQALPFSVCTLLRDEEVYSAITPEQEEKDRNARSRYNGRLFLSWLQDVDDKWEKIKEAMLLRHHNEAESLHAVQKMDWEWKLKEMSLCEPQVKPTIDDLQVPMVHVSDDFDLLPA